MIDLPGEAPSRAAIAAQLVRSANRSEELRCSRCDVPARMQSEQMREVSMVRFGILELLKPLEQLAFTSDAVRRQAREGRLELSPKRVIDVQHFACVKEIEEQVAHQREVHRRCHRYRGAPAIRRDELELR